MSAFGTKRTSRHVQPMSAFGGKADIRSASFAAARQRTFDPQLRFFCANHRRVVRIWLCQDRIFWRTDLACACSRCLRFAIPGITLARRFVTFYPTSLQCVPGDSKSGDCCWSWHAAWAVITTKELKSRVEAELTGIMENDTPLRLHEAA